MIFLILRGLFDLLLNPLGELCEYVIVPSVHIPLDMLRSGRGSGEALRYGHKVVHVGVFLRLVQNNVELTSLADLIKHVKLHKLLVGIALAVPRLNEFAKVTLA